MRGEAHFEVVHNSQRPFEVSAGKGLVRALGTAFTVHIRKVDIEVIVTEGIIELDKAEMSDGELVNMTGKPASAQLSVGSSKVAATELAVPFTVGIEIKAGQKFVYDREVLDMVKLIVADKIEEELSWRQGMLVFKSEPLEKVVEEVSRYTSLKIVIPQRDARELLVGGIFSVGDTESLFEALRESFDINVELAPDGVVYLISGDKRDR
jgi:transmembrane sensor